MSVSYSTIIAILVMHKKKIMSKVANVFKSLWQSVGGTVIAHPAATVMLAYACLMVNLGPDAGMWSYPLATVPIFVVLAVGIDCLWGGRVKGLSWSMAVLLALTALIPGIDRWEGGIGFNITMFVVLPLVTLVFRNTASNESFIRNAVWTIWSAFLSLALVSVLVLVLVGTSYSLDILFDISVDRLNDILVYTSYILVAPMLFIGMSEREDIPSISRIVDIIVNWIISPAAVIYSAILFTYMGKILVQWSLPCGGVALMCFIWGLAMFVIAASQPMLQRHPFSWLVRIYGFLSIPLMVMLWVAIGRRVMEYGITPSRYFLLLCGLAMTVSTLMLLWKGRNRYFRVTLFVIVLFVLGLAAPGINYRSATVMSQLRRAKDAAASIGLLGDGGLLLAPDTDRRADRQYQEKAGEVYSSLKAVMAVRKTACSEVGVDDIGIYATCGVSRPERMIALHLPQDVADICLDGFSKASFNHVLPVRADQDGCRYFEVGEEKVFVDEMLDAQMTKSGLTGDASPDAIRARQMDFLIYEHQDFTICFRDMCIIKYGNGRYAIDDSVADIWAILYR